MIRNILLKSLLWIGVYTHSWKLIDLYIYCLTAEELLVLNETLKLVKSKLDES
jgi:hypothetical protein